MFWFLVIAGLAMIERKYNITGIMLGWGIFGMIFVGYFVHGEYLLGAICPYCTIAHASIILIFELKGFFAMSVDKNLIALSNCFVLM